MPTLGEKYLGAWQETSTRIQARDQVLSWFITLASLLIGASFSNFAPTAAGIVLGYASLATALLTSHHDLIIGYLGDYQNELYVFAKEHQNDSTPEWFSKHNFDRVLYARRLRDWAQLFIIGPAGITGLWLAWQSPTVWSTCPRRLIFYESVSCFVTSIFLIILTNLRRQRIWQHWTI